MIQLIFLGTSAGVPTRQRNTSALALRPEQSSYWILFDCAEATQHRILQTSLSLYKLKRIFITHLHGDHSYGLFALLASRGMLGCKEPIELYGPYGLKDLLQCVINASGLHLPYKIEIRELRGDETLDFGDYRIEPVVMSHSIRCYGYAFIESEKRSIDRIKAEELGIPKGPLLKRLKDGYSIKLADGKIIEPDMILSKAKQGRRILIGGDNDRPELFERYKGADLLVHEASYTQKDFDRLPKSLKHTTALQLGCAAKKLRVKALAATHFSPRYDRLDRLSEIEREIRVCYPGPLYLASDLMQIDI